MKTNYFYFLLFFMSACYNPDDYQINLRKNNTDILELIAMDRDIPADNFSVAFIDAFIPVDADINSRDVVFETTAGTFRNGERKMTITASLPVLLGEQANTLWGRAILTSTDRIEAANVSATIGGVTQRVQIRFFLAYPDSLRLEIPAFEMESGFNHEITIKSTLTKIHGTPSIGNVVHYEVFDVDGSRFPLANFRTEMLASDSSGKTSVVFTAGVSTSKGVLRIHAYVNTDNGVVEDTAYINLK